MMTNCLSDCADRGAVRRCCRGFRSAWSVGLGVLLCCFIVVPASARADFAQGDREYARQGHLNDRGGVAGGGGIDEGACCLSDGSCEFGTESDCSSAGGTYQGTGVDCTPELCVVPGACCLPDGSCIEEDAAQCKSFGGIPGGEFVLCVDIDCPQPGACCLPDGTCEQAFELGGVDCTGIEGVYQGDDTLCGSGVMCASPSCPGSGPCLYPHQMVGCQNAECCNAICALDAFCCGGEWDAQCVDAALANPVCVSSACNANAGSCGSPNGTPGCDDPLCCAQLCEFDPFCCETVWDGLCVNGASRTLACGARPTACTLPDGTCLDTLGFIGCNVVGGELSPPGVACGLPPCRWDCSPAPDGNGNVTVDDLVAVINSFGDPGGPCDVEPDNGDGTFGNGAVTIDDLVGVINNFGPCPGG
jgi:hypothetical protein